MQNAFSVMRAKRTWSTYQDESLCQEIAVFAVTRSQAAAAKRPPPPPVEAPPPSRVPSIGPLPASILNSTDKLFFVAHRIPGSDVSEWALVRIDIPLSISDHPARQFCSYILVQTYI